MQTSQPGLRRRSQGERRAATRRALLDAAVSSLADRGYAKTTTSEVAHRAGVSIGALEHHFPFKADLLVAALEHVLQQRVAEFDQILSALDGDTPEPGRLVDLTWQLVQSPAFVAWLELWVAARCDADLQAATVEVDARFTEAVAARWACALPGGTLSERPEVARSLLFAVCNGLALRRIAPVPHEADAQEVLSLLKSRLLGAGGEAA